MLIGQLILAQGNDFVYNQKPIDYAHWFLWVGSVFLIPQIVSSPKSIYSLVGIPVTLLGVACVIGMCVLDFIWWSFPNEEARMEFTNHISQVPSIWKPFVEIGSSAKVFNTGLLILSLHYFKKEKVGVISIVLATLILWHLIPVPHRLIWGYLLTLIGYTLILLRSGTDDELQQRI